jgi:hypothetical protein
LEKIQIHEKSVEKNPNLVEIGQKISTTLDKDLNKCYLIVAGGIKSP